MRIVTALSPSAAAATKSLPAFSETVSVTARSASTARSAVTVNTAFPPSVTDAAFAVTFTTGGGRSSSAMATVPDEAAPTV